MPKQLDLTDYELELVRKCVTRFREDLIQYKTWINDRPMLPERELALAQVDAECRRLLDLSIKLYNFGLKELL